MNIGITAGLVTTGLLALLLLGIPIAYVLGMTGIFGLFSATGGTSAWMALTSGAALHLSSSSLLAIPLFMLMSAYITESGMGPRLLDFTDKWFRKMPGSLYNAAIAACGAFSTMSGSSVATAGAIGGVVLPEFKRRGLNMQRGMGAVAAGGTLGVLIPPSTAFIVYAILTEQSIGRLLLAGVFPGLLLALLFVITISVWTRFSPNLGPPGPVASRAERMKTLGRAGPMLTIVAATIGGIYLGIFTPTEAAAVGAFLAVGYALIQRTLGGGKTEFLLLETVKTTAFVFLILIGALIFGPFLALSGLPQQFAAWLTSFDLPSYVILIFLLLLYIFLGMFLEGFAMMVLTLPIVVPIVQALGFDLIWFGVLMVVVLEMGLISPPVGINVFVVKGLVPDVPLSKVFAGIMPFWLAMGVCLVILMIFPQIALYLPDTMLK